MTHGRRPFVASASKKLKTKSVLVAIPISAELTNDGSTRVKEKVNQLVVRNPPLRLTKTTNPPKSPAAAFSFPHTLSQLSS
jgi:hypothetical protein